MSSLEARLLLGRDHALWGHVAHAVLQGGLSACALSVGADPRTPARTAKGDARRCPNEDAVLVADDGRIVLLAVADAHYGCESSHRLLEALDAHVGRAGVPPAADSLAPLLAALADSAAYSVEEPASETTLTVAVVDREARQVSWATFGDSSLVVLRPGEETALGAPTPVFVSPARPQSLSAGRGLLGHAVLRPGDLVVAFTDGVDGSHYGSPATSVRARHRLLLFAHTGPDPAAYAPALAHLALDGVDGHPGGQDNVAVAAARV